MTETKNEQTMQITIEVRLDDQGWVQGGFRCEDEFVAIARIPSPPFAASEAVRKAFASLMNALAEESVREAFGGKATITGCTSSEMSNFQRTH